MRVEAIKRKAHSLFDSAPFLAHIHNQDDYEQALALMDNLIEILSVSIERWEDSADEFSNFNARIADISAGIATLKIIMEQYKLGVADLPEIGSKSLVSK